MQERWGEIPEVNLASGKICSCAEVERGGTPDQWLISSSCLSDQFLLRFGIGPRRWRKLSDLGDLGCRQPREQILQIIKRVDPVPPTTAQQCVYHRAALPGFRMSDEHPIAFSKCAGPN